MKMILCSALLLFAFSVGAQAQEPVPLARGNTPGEPHHHLKIENEYVRAYYVEAPPHEATQLHQHDHDYLFVTLGDSDVMNELPGKPAIHLVLKDGEVHFTRGGFAHVARNLSDQPFRNVTIELLKPQGETQNLCAQVVPGGLTGACQRMSVDRRKDYTIEPQFETTEIKLDLVRLDSKTKDIGVSPKTALLLVVLDKSEVKIKEQDKTATTLNEGGVMWLEAASRETMSNPSKKPASLLQLTFKDSGQSAKP